MPRSASIIASLAVLLLAGCAPSAGIGPEPALPPTEAPTPVADGAPLQVDCSALVSDQAMYDYNPNFGGFDGYSVDAGSAAARILELEGTACAWQNETGGELLVVAAANPSSVELEALEADSAFAIQDGVGTAQAFSGYYWIVASSEDFLEEADAKPILDEAIKALG